MTSDIYQQLLALYNKLLTFILGHKQETSKKSLFLYTLYIYLTEFFVFNFQVFTDVSLLILLVSAFWLFLLRLSLPLLPPDGFYHGSAVFIPQHRASCRFHGSICILYHSLLIGRIVFTPFTSTWRQSFLRILIGRVMMYVV